MSTLAQVKLILYCVFFFFLKKTFYIVRTENSPLAAALTFYRDLFVPAIVAPEPRRNGLWHRQMKKERQEGRMDSGGGRVVKENTEGGDQPGNLRLFIVMQKSQ